MDADCLEEEILFPKDENFEGIQTRLSRPIANISDAKLFVGRVRT